MIEKKINEITAEDLKTKIIVYPTDTVYGVGCNALDSALVDKVCEIKKRDRGKPISVIAPSKEWILRNFACAEGAIDKYLPGAYTLVLKKKNPGFLKGVSVGNSVGVRIIMHDFQNVVSLVGVPFVTTSANVSGDESPTSFGRISEEVKNKVDVLIDGGKLSGKPSKVIDLTEDKERIIRE